MTGPGYPAVDALIERRAAEVLAEIRDMARLAYIEASVRLGQSESAASRSLGQRRRHYRKDQKA